jgi:osmotically-inducible protein OsmY
MTRNSIAACALALVLPVLGGCLPLAATGVATGVLVAEDRRSSGTIIDDQVIETKAAAEITANYKDTHVGVVSYNRAVLLVGEAPSEAARQDIERRVRAIGNVRAVQNDLVVGPPSSLASRTKDSYITSKVKARLVEDNRIQANHVKVVTEAGIVYLLGLVSRSEAEAATQVARTTSDVVKVVRVFEYLD